MKAFFLATAGVLALTAIDAAEMTRIDMKDMSPTQMAKDANVRKHTAKGIVKSVDPKAQTVTLDHEPVKSLNWSAMSMTFKVKDKTLMSKLAQGQKVEVEFEQR